MNNTVGKWLIDEQSHCIVSDDEKVELNLATFKLLQLFASCPGEIISLSKIKEEVWQNEFTTNNVVYQTIRNLRMALEGDSGKSYIKTVPRHGYQLLVKIDDQMEGSVPALSGDENMELPAVPQESTGITALVCNKLNTRRWRLMLAIIATMMIVMVAVIKISWVASISQPTKNMSPSKGRLVIIDDIVEISEQQRQIFSHYQQKVVLDSNMEKTRLSSTENLLSKLDQMGDQHKLVVQYLPVQKAILNLVFVGKPSRLAYLSVQPVDKITQKADLEKFTHHLLAVFDDPMLDKGNSGIAGLLRENQEAQALASLSFGQTERLQTARQSIREAIEKYSLNEQQKKAKYYFIETLYAFYQIESFDDKQLHTGVNYLLSHYSQSNYSLVAAAFYLANKESVSIAFQLLEYLEQDPFVTYIQGLLHYELDELTSALKHFEKVYRQDKDFQDNTYFYLELLLSSKRRQEFGQIYTDLKHENYISTNIYYLFYNWLLMQGDFPEAINLLSRDLDKLICNDDLYGAMALINNALANPTQVDKWQGLLTSVESRDWRPPWLFYVRMLNENNLPAYAPWYEEYRKGVLGQDSFIDPIIFVFTVRLALGEYEQVDAAMEKLEQAWASFNEPAFIEVAKVVLKSQLARQQGQNTDDLLASVEEQVIELQWDEIPYINQVLASYYILSDDFASAEVHLIDGCNKNPAICSGWQNIPLLAPIMQTKKLQLSLEKAEQVIRENQSRLTALNSKVAASCPAL
ncbi:winged helix-turn-helix domain-containing protein [Thalassomonas actiniarum]|uniref:Winged helix-turn-helix domain-containing protein n=1 Tax=Thalassomonas actiniarum TaxID=485447 RepID=A0AAE9YXQ4_9GAMM|nr:winged helix-turn-helix domain-containing protein [Thalassomonas actiniarum]WDE02304.1 winged helix-turn-helix domain-containing protein [Thalassomonas actiniarum]